MSSDELPKIKSLHTYTDMMQTSVLDTLFEPSPAIHTTLLPVMRTAVYGSYADLIDVFQIKLLSIAAIGSSSPAYPTLLSALESHPRLGEKKITSAQSAAEQASLEAKDESEESQLEALNEEYESKFPGLRYVVFVNGRPRSVIFQDMRERIDRGDFSKEVAAAIQAMCDIAKHRAQKILAKKD